MTNDVGEPVVVDDYRGPGYLSLRERLLLWSGMALAMLAASFAFYRELMRGGLEGLVDYLSTLGL